MSRKVHWVDRAQDVAAVAGAIAGGPLAVDTEADSFHHYREKVCLIQLSHADRDVLIDPLADVDLSALREPLGDRGVRKILHGADYDVRMLHRDLGLEVHGLFDTMVAARLIGERAFGLSALLEKFLDVRLEKQFQRADWSVRPLPPEMVEYAVLDTRHLEVLAGLLERRLEELGRDDWAREEFERVEAVRWRTEKRPPEEAFLRVKGIRKLDRRRLGLLREIAALREQTARDRDVPPFRVMRDDVMLQLVQDRPEDRKSLRRVRGLPTRWSRDPEASRLLEAVDRGRSVPDESLPPPPRSEKRRRPDPQTESRVRKLCEERKRIAEGLGLEPGLVAPRAALERVVAGLDGADEVDDAPPLRRWQQALLEPAIRTLRE